MTALVEPMFLRHRERLVFALAPESGMTVRQFVNVQPSNYYVNLALGDVLMFRCEIRRFITTFLSMYYSEDMSWAAGRVMMNRVVTSLGEEPKPVRISNFLRKDRGFEGLNRKLMILQDVPHIISSDPDSVYHAWVRIFIQEIYDLKGKFPPFAEMMQEVFDALER